MDVPSIAHQIGADWVRNWTSNFINQAKYSYSRSYVDFGGEAGGKWASCNITGIHTCPAGYSIGGSLGSYGFANNLPQDRDVKTHQVQDNATYVHGRHTFKAGGEWDHQFSPNHFLPNNNGTYSFSSLTNVIRNRPTNVSLADGTFGLNFTENDIAFYAQDDWKVKDNLTLNIGMRWEWNQQAINLLHNLTTARETGPGAFWGAALPLASKTVPQVPQDYNNFAPNFGFAWTPHIWQGIFGQDKTVFRGGFRIAYDPSFYNIFLNVATSAPMINAATINGPNAVGGGPAVVPTSGFTGADVRAANLGFIPLGGDPTYRNWTTVAPNFHNPYTEQWSFGMQRQLGSKIAVESRYVGNHTIGNFQTINANPQLCRPGAAGSTTCNPGLFADFPSLVPSGIVPCTTGTVPNSAGTTGTQGFGKVNCAHGNIRERANTAFSIYHSWQNELRIQNWHGLTSGLAYTWSHAIDNVSEIFGTFAGGNTVAFSQNAFDSNVAERGTGGTSYPNVASIYSIYDLPMFKGQQGFLGHTLGGWQVNGTWRYLSDRSALQHSAVQLRCFRWTA